MRYKPRGRSSIPAHLTAVGRHLVYAEGTRTEPNYVKEIRGLLSCALHCSERDNPLVFVEKKKGMHTKELLAFAENDVDRRVKEGETVSCVWIFLDKDAFADFEETLSAITRKNTNRPSGNPNAWSTDKDGIHWVSCGSNECFEVWLLLYFAELSGPLPREEYIPRINAYLKKSGERYDKNTGRIHDLLTRGGGDVHRAIARAERLNAGIGRGYRNPSTGVDEFARYFFAYIDQAGK